MFDSQEKEKTPDLLNWFILFWTVFGFIYTFFSFWYAVGWLDSDSDIGFIEAMMIRQKTIVTVTLGFAVPLWLLSIINYYFDFDRYF